MIFYYQHKSIEDYAQREIDLLGYNGVAEYATSHGLDPNEVFTEIKHLEHEIERLNAPSLDISQGNYQKLLDRAVNEYIDFFNKNAVHGKQAYVVIGNVASGKSYYSKKIQDATSSIIVDADHIKMGEETPHGFYEGLSSLYSPLERDKVQEPCSIAAKKVLDHVSSQGFNLVLPKAPSSYEKLQRQIELLESRNYDVHMIMIESPLEVCANRNYVRYLIKEYAQNFYPNGTREHGRFVPVSVVKFYGDKVYSTFAKAYQQKRYKSYHAMFNNNQQHEELDLASMKF